MNIDKKILYELIERKVQKEKRSESWKEDILYLVRKVIFYDPTENYVYKGNESLLNLIPSRRSLFKAKKGSGLPIGNYSSQFFANVYLNELDQFVKRKLKCKYYVRYVDDFVLLSRNLEELKTWREKINWFLATINFCCFLYLLFLARQKMKKT